MIIGVGDVFKADNGHVGVITAIGDSDPPPHPMKEVIKRIRRAGPEAEAWLMKTKARRRGWRKALRDQEAREVKMGRAVYMKEEVEKLADDMIAGKVSNSRELFDRMDEIGTNTPEVFKAVAAKEEADGENATKAAKFVEDFAKAHENPKTG